MKLLLVGADGQLGWELRRALAPLGTVVACGRLPGETRVDLEDEAAVAARVRAERPDVVVNAAAYTAVDQAEREAERAFAVNARAPGVLAREAAALGAWLVHYGSDYVFDGSGHAARDESAPTAPLSTYGRSKLEGEERVRASGCRHLILRTSWVHAARGGNFAATMLRLAAERDRLRVVADQVGAPTGADLLADVTAHALRVLAAHPERGGLYHCAASGETSFHGYARHVIAWGHAHGLALRTQPDAVEPITTADFPLPAARPLNSRLDTRRLRAAFGVELPGWQQGVERMLHERFAR